MPYINDPKTGKTAAERKKEALEKWRKKSIESGYGKWLYARRKLRFDDAERFRKALERIEEAADFHEATSIATVALIESRHAEEELGRFSKI